MRINDRVARQELSVRVPLQITLHVIFAKDAEFLDRTHSK